MGTTFRIKPPTLVPWLSDSERESTAFLINADADLIAQDCLRVALDIIFRPLVVQIGMIRKIDYHVGSIGAQAYIEATDGMIGEHTGPQKLEVRYSNKTSRTRTATVSFSPEIKFKAVRTDSSAKLGEIRWEAKTQADNSVDFSCSEMILAPIVIGNNVTWRLDRPRGEQAVRDFLIGNYRLYADCSWGRASRRGRFGGRADLRFFDDQRRELPKHTSLLMLYRLWRAHRLPSHTCGFEIAFEEVGNE
jgi:hypothetical protein